VASTSISIRDESFPVDYVRLTVEGGIVDPPYESNYIAKDSPSCTNIIFSGSHSISSGHELYLLRPHDQGCFLSGGLGLDRNKELVHLKFGRKSAIKHA
jgi:hypothetical protein